MNHELYEPDQGYSHGRLFTVGFLVLMPLICLFPRWVFHYRWDEHFIVEPQSLTEKPKISRFIETIPGPRLQSQPKQDLENYRTRQMRELDTYGWSDRETGMARIPMHEAMECYLKSSTPNPAP